MADETTLSIGEPRGAVEVGVPQLFVVLSAEQPRQPSSMHSLDGIDSVDLGRGGARAIERGSRELKLRFADRWMSSEHARLTRSEGGWRVEDRGSKNGVFVNGTQVSETALTDGDVIEAGHTFLVFRERGARGEWPPDFSAPPETRSLNPALVGMLGHLELVARRGLPILIQGETGTGKELVARAVHGWSGRSGPFLAVNCGALSKTLIESELFGFKKGAFSGANEDRPGLVRAAEGGTLFLDEVGELPAAAQAALLRVLQEHEVLPIGATRVVPVDVRIVAATHRDLESLVRTGDFRADLLSRLSGFLGRLPPLRERREDLGLLVATLLQRAQAPADLAFDHLAARTLFSRRWPRNVRQLERSLQAAVALTGGRRVIQEEDLYAASGGSPDEADPTPSVSSPTPVAPPPPTTTPKSRDERRRAELLTLAVEHQGNVAAMARALGKAREQVQRWLKRYAIDPDHYRR